MGIKGPCVVAVILDGREVVNLRPCIAYAAP